MKTAMIKSQITPNNEIKLRTGYFFDFGFPG